MQRPASVREFQLALQAMPLPRGRQRKFLKAHANAKGRALNMRSIARAAGYKSYRGANLQYGLLAERIAKVIGRRPAGVSIGLLVEFLPPKGRSADHISNDEWILIMREPFAVALARTGWI
jgi:hypothetical protein